MLRQSTLRQSRERHQLPHSEPLAPYSLYVVSLSSISEFWLPWGFLCGNTRYLLSKYTASAFGTTHVNHSTRLKGIMRL